jgi:tetratricopeptide (TPR) repeat protein
MSNVEKLKKKAAEFEQKKQFDRALETYVQIIEHTKGNEDKDVAVYNRVGDLYLRLNKTDQAVHYYELAVDLYTDGGYLNNAIALCNKILRHAPSRNQIYYKLGKISAKKGFNSDAKKNFLEYADRMHKAGRDTDAFKALEEFADLCPGQDDIRLMLAEQLAKAGKTEEAVEQLQILHESLDAEGRSAEAQAAVKRMHTLDPTVEPRRSKTPRTTETDGLVFLDLGNSPPKPRPKLVGLEPTSLAPEPPRRQRTPQHVQPAPEIEQLSDLEVLTPDAEVPAMELEQLPGADVDPSLDSMIGDLELPPLEGLESNAQPESFELTIDEIPIEEMPIDGLVSATGEHVVPDPQVGLDARSVTSPFDSPDPLAGLNVLEDDRFYEDDPLAGAKSLVDPQLETPDSIEAADDDDPVDIAALAESDEIEERADEEEEEEEDEEEEEASSEPELESWDPLPEPEPEPRRPAKKTPSRPKLVEDKRRTPKRSSKQQPEYVEEAAPEPPRGARKGPINPFKRNAQVKKEAPPEPTPARGEKSRAATPKKNAPQIRNTPHLPKKGGGDADFVDLADWLRQDSAPRSTRMVAKDDKRVGDEQADFSDMLEKFKAGVAANVDDEDFDSHYDLGIAYREMGLIDEAVAEFQKALRGATHRIRAYEALGQCFIDRSEFDVAITVLSRSLREPGLEDDDLIGVLYLLGYAAEENGQPRDAAAYYQRVFAIDIDFRDVGDRLKSMSKAAAK